MTFTARVLMQRLGRDMPIDIGVIEVEPRPARFGRTTFRYKAEPVVGRVEQIAPPDWDNRPGTVPWILMIVPLSVENADGSIGVLDAS
jgi:hypothetical protein